MVSTKAGCVGAGHYTRKITLQKPTTPSDGETKPTFANVATVRAEILAVGGGERVRGQQIEAGVTTMVTMRYRSDVDLNPDWRIKYGTRFLNIVRIYDPDQSRRMLVAQCQEVV